MRGAPTFKGGSRSRYEAEVARYYALEARRHANNARWLGLLSVILAVVAVGLAVASLVVQ